MKLFYFLPMMLIGCLKPIPPAPELPHVVLIAQVPEQPALIIVEEVDAGPPVQTWLTGVSQKVLDDRAKQERKCDCDDGDPLCGCLE